MSSARDRGWGWPGTPGSSEDRAYQRDHLVIIETGGVRLRIRREIARLVAGFVNELAIRGYRLDDMADDWGFNNRDIRGYPGRKSNHAWGLAIDLNATKNPMLQGRLVTDMPGWVPIVARNWGLHWGGYYTERPDPMHFEFLGRPEDIDRYPLNEPQEDEDMTEDQERLLNETAMRAVATQTMVEDIKELLTKPLQPLMEDGVTRTEATPRHAWARAAAKK